MKKKFGYIFTFVGLLAWVLAGCSSPAAVQSAQSAPKTELVVSAAASLQDSLNTLKGQYEKQHPDIKLTFNYASSGTLQKQIEQGAPVDVFISAGMKQMKALTDASLVEKDNVLLQNKLVVVVPQDTTKSTNNKSITLSDLTGSSFLKLAVGEPATVPAGQYSKEALTKAGLWDKLEPKMVFAKDVRQVLNYVETGNADAGLVYLTDAKSSDKTVIAMEVPERLHAPILYPEGIVKATKHSQEAGEFLDFLRTDEAMSVFSKDGFSAPTEMTGK
ncbi:molybdate ABC transporter substrate-binding protein [Paenibacillus sp. LX16]|uniref:molybdate ABC transporter substrate-binding protein n=1 Tax=Paenibacillus sp. LX16 TaxID=1740264 RepID=UPI002E285EC8|nr:molybdate ABC transporter substrate-binding protein [Paenibacillus sp. LX16]